MSWFWRTKPRSIIKTLQWFPHFGSLEGQNWDEASNRTNTFNHKNIYPVRRSYIYHAHGEEDSWLSTISFDEYLSGSKDQKETESNGRNDKTTFEFFGFGYVDKDGIIHTTENGQKIMQGLYDQERYLKQLLKLHLPNPIQKVKSSHTSPSIFPMQLILQVFSKYDSLNRCEIALLFGCDHQDQLPALLCAIESFKERYNALSNKLDTKQVKELFLNVYEEYLGTPENKVNSYLDYAEAFSRSLAYTGLFSLSGRSLSTKVRVASHAKKKIELLQRSFTFVYPAPFSSLSSYMDWYGSDTNVILPWDNIAERKELVQEKISLLQNLMKQQPTQPYHQHSFVSQQDLDLLFLQTANYQSVSELKDVEKSLDQAITNHNEEHFIRVASKTQRERSAILDKFSDILANDDMSALWLEVNTWKSFIAIQGKQKVKRNFNIEEDLSPRSFAPGIGNTPDMELYYKNMILLPEVSLMTGVRQWEHEASSVIDHVMHFMEQEPNKQVCGLFLSTKIHLRTMWQFFILNRESWLGKSVPVVPLTIPQFVALITHCYEKEISIETFLSFLLSLASKSRLSTDYKHWEQQINDNIQHFICN